MVALVLAIIGLIFCGGSLILLACLIPALILAIIVSGTISHVLEFSCTAAKCIMQLSLAAYILKHLQYMELGKE